MDVLFSKPKCTWNHGTGLQGWCEEESQYVLYDSNTAEASPFAYLCPSHKDQTVGVLEKQKKPFRVVFLREAYLVLPENESGSTMLLHPLGTDLQVGDKVIDLTAEENGWPDVKGEVRKIDGSNVLVRYESGNERLKMSANLRKFE